MSASKMLAIAEGFASEDERRKRLGQYFTGAALSRLVAALAEAGSARSVLDPMAGSGDMLVACREVSDNNATFGAVEIDPVAAGVCLSRAPWATTFLGSAFDSSFLANLPRSNWDLVITNPPYVRYQSLSKSAGSSFHLPSGMEVRSGLLSVIEKLDHLDVEDRSLFAELVSGYSGLADLAVPAWILCAAMCAQGGRLALVLPESWLSRDYAAVVQYLLLRWFKIRYVVEDAHAVWFDNAQVKTTVLIAERIERRGSAFDWPVEDTFLRLRIFGSAKGAEGMVSKMFPDSPASSELRFVELIRQLSISSDNHFSEFMEAYTVSLSSMAENLRRGGSKYKWLSKLEGAQKSANAYMEPYSIPDPLSGWLASINARPHFTTLGSIGVGVGQGLRSGANGFFYVDALSPLGDIIEVETSATLGSHRVEIPARFALPVLRKQSELPQDSIVDARVLKGRVLVLHGCVLPEDAARFPEAASSYEVMAGGVAGIVRAGDCAYVGGKRIPELTAVSPNVRPGNPKVGSAPRFWYMLPDLAPRHRPDVIVPRVNGGSARAFLNIDRSAVVDANFSTLWIEKGGTPDAWALVALINSSWCVATLEYSAAVMGGGALKVEATHLRKLPIPNLSCDEWRRLSECGRKFAHGNITPADIDYIIIGALIGRSPLKSELVELAELAKSAQLRRAQHRKNHKE